MFSTRLLRQSNNLLHKHQAHLQVLGKSLFSSSAIRKNVTATQGDGDCLHVKWDSDATSAYSYLWLRDNCQCASCLHPYSRQKLHSSADIPLDIKPSAVKILGEEAEITWNQPLRHNKAAEDSHVSRFPLDFLRLYQSDETSEKFRFNHLRPQTWNSQEYKLDWVSYDDYMNTEEGLHTVVQRLYNRGLVFLKDVPMTDEACTQVGERIGPIQETFYGRDFDVKNVAKSINIAYTSLYLGFHMDLMYV
jgi:gamma-butyrobetaine dioxygenase